MWTTNDTWHEELSKLRSYMTFVFVDKQYLDKKFSASFCQYSHFLEHFDKMITNVVSKLVIGGTETNLG